MRQRGTVEAVSDRVAVISVVRESACSGDCHKCAGCGAVAQTLQIHADNPIGARKGDRVYVESSTRRVLWAAVVVYLVPLLGFFLGYFLGQMWGYVAVGAVMGFLIGWIPALLYNTYTKKRPPVYTLVAFVEQEWKS